MDNRRSTGIITSIQLLRILAAVAVVIVHAEPAFKAGPSGVDIFFVISGFIILLSSRSLFGKKGGWRTFVKNRIVRIVPLYWVATSIMITLLISIGGYVPTLQRVFSSLFFIPYCDPCGPVATVEYLPVLSVGWTLNCEMFFYALFAVAIVLPLRMAVVAIAVAIFALPLTPASETISAFSFYWSNPLLLEFLFGFVVAWMYSFNFRLPAVVGIISVGVGLATIYFNRETGNSPDGFHRLLVWGLPAALVVVSAAFTRWPSFGMTTAKVTKYLGAASYAVYLFHPIVIMLTTALPLWAKIAAAVIVGVTIHAMERLVHRAIRTWCAKVPAEDGRLYRY